MSISDLVVHAIPALKDNYIYALVSGNQCAIVDPGEAAPVERFLGSRELSLIMCTHHHPDHVAGVPDLLNSRRAEVWCSTHDQSRVPGLTRGVREGDALEVFGHRLEVIELPGHTLGQIGYWLPDLNMLFTGDTLFTCGCGRLFEGTAEQMFASLQKIKALPAETRIYFGHEYSLRNIEFVATRSGLNSDLAAHRIECERRLAAGLSTTPTTLAQELRINPFLQAESVEEFRRWRSARDIW